MAAAADARGDEKPMTQTKRTMPGYPDADAAAGGHGHPPQSGPPRSTPALPERAKSILYAGNPGSQNCTGGSGGAGGTAASACAPSLLPSPCSRSPASGAMVDVGVRGPWGDPRGITGIGSGDSAREGPPLDEADTAPPCIRNGTQERFEGGTEVGFGAGTGSRGVSRRERKSRRRLDPCGRACRRDL